MKILVVDDDAVSASVTEAALEHLGHQTVLLDQALGAMGMIAREKPDVALIDVKMPGLAGDRLAAVLTERHPGLLVYLHSSLPASELAALATTSGAAGYIEKRGGPAEFARTFKRLIDERHAGARSPGSRSRP